MSSNRLTLGTPLGECAGTAEFAEARRKRPPVHKRGVISQLVLDG